MSISGMQIDEAIVKRYEEKRFNKEAGGLVLKIENEEIKVELDANPNFSQMVDSLPDDEPRFVLYDVPLKNRAGLEDVKTVFILYMPMEASVRLRMQYASAKSIINTKFRGISAQIQPDEKSELSMDNIMKKINKSQGINNY